MKFFSLIFTTMLIAACATTGKIKVVDKTSANYQLPEQHGVVVAKVINASPYSQSINFITLTPKNVYESENNKFQRLQSIKEFSGKTTIFASPLTAGEYSLSDVLSFHNFDTHYYKLFASADPRFGTFNVEPGKVTSLGTIIYYQKPDGDRYVSVLVRKDEFDDAMEILSQDNAALHQQVDTSNLLSWNEDDYAEERYNSYLNVVQNPVTFDVAYPQEDGGWFFTSKLGVLLHRSAQREWSMDALDTDYNLTVFGHNSRGDKAVVNEKSDIFFKAINSERWQKIQAPETQGKLAHIQLGEAGDLYAIYLFDYRIETYMGDISDEPIWSRKLIYQPDAGWITPIQYDQKQAAIKAAKAKGSTYMKESKAIKNFNAFISQDKTLISSNQKFYELDLKRSDAKEIPIDFKIVDMNRNSYDQLSISKTSLWDGRVVTQYSLDAGKTWNSFTKKFDNCPNNYSMKDPSLCKDRKRRFRSRSHVGTPVFFADGMGYSILKSIDITGGFITPIERTTTFFLAVSSDGGNTWVKSEKDELPKYCSGLRKGGKETLLLSCEYSTGAFYTANRTDLKWQTDYQPTLF